MTARGQLFIEENIKSDVEGVIDEYVTRKYGDNTSWRLDGNKFSDYYDESKLPQEGDANIIIEFEDNEKIIGKVNFILDFTVAGEDQDKYIDVEIKNTSVSFIEEIMSKPISEKNKLLLKVTISRFYYIEGCINGWDKETIIQDWFKDHKIDSYHATRDSHEFTEKLVNIETVKEGDFTINKEDLQ